MTMSDNYLAHSKGPWKKHKYSAVRIGANGKKQYVYNDSKTGGYYVAGTGVKGVQRVKPSAGTKLTKAKRKVQTTVRDAKYYGGKTARKASSAAKSAAGAVAGTAKRVGAQAKNKAYATPYLAKAYKDKAGFAAKDAKKAVTNAVNKATGTTASQRKAKVRVAKYNANKAVKRGMAAINKLFGKAKSTAKRVGAQAKNKAYAAPYLAKAYKDKAKFDVSDAKKAAKKVKNTAQRKTAIAKGRVKDLKGKQQVRNLNKIRKNVAKAKKKHSS